MSGKLDNAQFLLPSEFLTEEDIVMDSYGFLGGSSRLHFTPEFSNKHGCFSPSTGSSSPVESTETFSDEGDSLGSELTQLLSLLRTTRLTQFNQNHQDFGLSGSGLSTFTGLKSGSGGFIMPSYGNSNGPFQISSHANAPGCGNEDAWDLIYKAASHQVTKNNGGCGVAFPRNPGHLGQNATHKAFVPSSYYHSQLPRGENLLEQELWNIKEKNRLIFEQSYMKRAEILDSLSGGFNSFTSAMPEVLQKNQQFRPDSGAKVGYRFGPGYGCGSGVGIGGVKALKNERVGTGVFLPRRHGGAGTDDYSGNLHSRKKPGYASIGHQAKGNPSLSNLNNPQPHFIGGVRDSEAALVAQRAALLTGAVAMNNEVCLPQEWTY